MMAEKAEENAENLSLHQQRTHEEKKIAIPLIINFEMS